MLLSNFPGSQTTATTQCTKICTPAQFPKLAMAPRRASPRDWGHFTRRLMPPEQVDVKEVAFLPTADRKIRSGTVSRHGRADSRASVVLMSERMPAPPSVQECCTIPIGCLMPSETTYTSLRENLASVLDQVVDQQETVIVRRRGARDVALLPATELAGLMETAHLLRSPRNARRLQSALRRAEKGRTKPGTAAGLRREMLGEARS
jgi:antitoxin YefM